MSQNPVQRTQVAPGLFANFQKASIPDMEATGQAYEAFAAWFSDADGNLVGQKYCECKSGGLQQERLLPER